MIGIADCNSFFCSCERLFRPDLKNIPVVVLSNNDGCIVSRTDEAKKLGIGMAVPYFQNKELIEKNGVTVFSSNYHLYGDMSLRVMDTFRQFMGAELVEVYSVDEAFINFEHVPINLLRETSLQLKSITEQNTGIPICIGIAPNKLLSKIANKLSKKDKQKSGGVMVLNDEESIYEALKDFKVGDIWGIGGRYAYKLECFGINTAWQLRNMPIEWARKNLGGVVGVRLLEQLKGNAISYMQEPRTKKEQIATTRMFGKNVSELQDITEAIATYTARAAEKLRRQFSAAGEISVFLMYRNTNLPKGEYGILTSAFSIKFDVPTSNTIEMIKIATEIAKQLFCKDKQYKKGGVILSRIIPDSSIQGNIFFPKNNNQKILMNTIDNINFSMQPDMLTIGTMGIKKNWKMRQEQRSPRYTTHLSEIRIVN